MRRVGTWLATYPSAAETRGRPDVRRRPISRPPAAVRRGTLREHQNTKSRSAMQIKLGLRQTLLSSAVFSAVLLALVSIDPRVRDRITELAAGGDGLGPWGQRFSELGEALSLAVRHQSIENAPLLIFATVGAVLFVFMARA